MWMLLELDFDEHHHRRINERMKAFRLSRPEKAQLLFVHPAGPSRPGARAIRRVTSADNLVLSDSSAAFEISKGKQTVQFRLEIDNESRLLVHVLRRSPAGEEALLYLFRKL